jgi:hypothetical protein
VVVLKICLPTEVKKDVTRALGDECSVHAPSSLVHLFLENTTSSTLAREREILSFNLQQE